MLAGTVPCSLPRSFASPALSAASISRCTPWRRNSALGSSTIPGISRSAALGSIRTSQSNANLRDCGACVRSSANCSNSVLGKAVPVLETSGRRSLRMHLATNSLPADWPDPFLATAEAASSPAVATELSGRELPQHARPLLSRLSISFESGIQRRPPERRSMERSIPK